MRLGVSKVETDFPAFARVCETRLYLYLIRVNRNKSLFLPVVLKQVPVGSCVFLLGDNYLKSQKLATAEGEARSRSSDEKAVAISSGAKRSGSANCNGFLRQIDATLVDTYV